MITHILEDREVIIRGVDFRFFRKVDMKGPNLANIGKRNHVLEKAKKI